jgi:hypothetical protein
LLLHYTSLKSPSNKNRDSERRREKRITPYWKILYIRIIVVYGIHEIRSSFSRICTVCLVIYFLPCFSTIFQVSSFTASHLRLVLNYGGHWNVWFLSKYYSSASGKWRRVMW